MRSMKMKTLNWLRLLWVLALGVILLVALPSCAAAPAPTATPAASGGSAVQAASESISPSNVRDLIDNSDKYAGKTVTITGTIALECPEGCWFFLDDGSAKIYVDLKPAGLTIPQKVGSRVILRGKIQGSGGNVQVLGDDVKFPDEAK